MSFSSNLDIHKAIAALSPVIGEFVWSIQCAEDHILRLNFGTPHLTIHEPQHAPDKSPLVQSVLGRRVVVPNGRWRLFIEDGLWTVETKTLKCSRFDTDQINLEKCLTHLDGQILSSIDFDDATSHWIFCFDLSGKLVIRPPQEFEGNSQWIMFFEDGSKLSYRDSSHIILSQKE